MCQLDKRCDLLAFGSSQALMVVHAVEGIEVKNIWIVQKETYELQAFWISAKRWQVQSVITLRTDGLELFSRNRLILCRPDVVHRLPDDDHLVQGQAVDYGLVY